MLQLTGGCDDQAILWDTDAGSSTGPAGAASTAAPSDDADSDAPASKADSAAITTAPATASTASAEVSAKSGASTEDVSAAVGAASNATTEAAGNSNPIPQSNFYTIDTLISGASQRKPSADGHADTKSLNTHRPTQPLSKLPK